jgi:glucokinase
VSSRTIKLTDLPQRICPAGRTALLNDLEAGAYGVLAVGEQGGLDDLFQQLFTDVAPSGPILSTSRTAVLAMGSGYGVALIVRTPMLKDPLVLPTELGHLQMPLVMAGDPNEAEEHELVQFVSDFYYQGTMSPEFEDIASARGLRLAYQFFYKKANGELIDYDTIDAGVIAQKAQAGDPVALEALTWHYKLFIRSAKAIAATLTVDSVVLALDNQVKNGWFVLQAADKLKDEFYTFNRPEWLKGVRVYTQTRLLNFNVLGTDYIAHRLAAD